MDFESSSKFISSLAKFLQSLCNGYVEFTDGVEVIGHIYINVDTGKKIDYILNEKVCKTDENSVTFISNSFHAQPAGNPKQAEKTPKSTEHDKISEASINETKGLENLESTNVGTLPPHQQQRPRPAKRPQQNFTSGHQFQSKFSRTDTYGSQSRSIQDNSGTHPENSLSQLPFSAQHSSNTDTMSHQPVSFPSPFKPPIDPPSSSESETKNIKSEVQLDPDISILEVKQEHASDEGVEGEQEFYDDSQMGGYSDVQYDQYYGDGSNSGQDYGQSGEGSAQGEYYHGGMSADGRPGESTGVPRIPPRGGYTCSECGKHCLNLTHLREHINGVHLKVSPHACPYCHVRMAYKGNLKRHMITCKKLRSMNVQSDIKPSQSLEGLPDLTGKFLSDQAGKLLLDPGVKFLPDSDDKFLSDPGGKLI